MWLELLTSKVGIAATGLVVLFAVLGIAGCREDRLNSRIDRLRTEVAGLNSRLGVCTVDLTIAKGGRDLLQEHFDALRDQARQDSAAHVVVLRLAKRTTSQLRATVDSLRARAARDTTVFNWEDLWF